MSFCAVTMGFVLLFIAEGKNGRVVLVVSYGCDS